MDRLRRCFRSSIGCRALTVRHARFIYPGLKSPSFERRIGLRSTFLLLAALTTFFSPHLDCQEPHALPLSGDYPVTHDPSIAREGDSYYVFATTSGAAK